MGNHKKQIPRNKQISITNFQNSLVFGIWKLFVTCFLVIVTSSVVYGQTSLPLLVAPVRQEITLKPSEQTSISVRFFNQGDSPVSGILRVADFLVLDKEGTPTIVEETSQASPRFSASAWFTLPYDRITIAANDKVETPVKISVPADARPGGRYVAVYFQPGGEVPGATFTPREAGTGVASRIASLVYIRIPGDAAEKALISSLFAKSFYEYGPIEVKTEILNRGDYHIRPKGVLSLSNMFGGAADQNSLKEENIFPDTARSYTNKLGSKWMLGRYKIELSASYGDKGQALSRAISIWVFPWRLALLIILTLIIIYLIIKAVLARGQKQAEVLEKELEVEKDEIDKLKEQLKKRSE